LPFAGDWEATMYAAKIFEFGNRFQNRLEPALLQGALDYVNFNEEALAFEILCDHISEYEIPISLDEYEEAIKLVSIFGLNLDEPPFRYLSGLVRG
jgi:hypothetical protein